MEYIKLSELQSQHKTKKEGACTYIYDEYTERFNPSSLYDEESIIGEEIYIKEKDIRDMTIEEIVEYEKCHSEDYIKALNLLREKSNEFYDCENNINDLKNEVVDLSERIEIYSQRIKQAMKDLQEKEEESLRIEIELNKAHNNTKKVREEVEQRLLREYKKED